MLYWRIIHSRIDEKWLPFVGVVGDMDNLNEDANFFFSSIHSSVNDVSAWDRDGTSGWNDFDNECDIAEQSLGLF